MPIGAISARLRLFALVALGALIVHQLRYAVEFRGDWREALAHQGHAYLTFVVPLILLAVAAGAVLFAVELRRASAGRCSEPRTPRFGLSWLATGSLLSALYVAQELTEGFLSHGHPEGLAAVVAGGGWTAFLFAFAVAFLIAVTLQGAEAAVLEAARGSRPARPALDRAGNPPPALHARPLDAVARNLAGRGPPLTSV